MTPVRRPRWETPDPSPTLVLSAAALGSDELLRTRPFSRALEWEHALLPGGRPLAPPPRLLRSPGETPTAGAGHPHPRGTHRRSFLPSRPRRALGPGSPRNSDGPGGTGRTSLPRRSLRRGEREGHLQAVQQQGRVPRAPPATLSPLSLQPTAAPRAPSGIGGSAFLSPQHRRALLPETAPERAPPGPAPCPHVGFARPLASFPPMVGGGAARQHR